MNIIQDTREKDPWNFGMYKQVTAVQVQGLKTGDYTTQEILQLEEEKGQKLLAVERKRSSSEIANNLGAERKRFFNEMERMAEYEFRYIICEFPKQRIYEFPENSGIPKRKWKYLRINSGYMVSQLARIETDYDVRIVFCNDKIEAQDFFIDLVNRIHDAYSD